MQAVLERFEEELTSLEDLIQIFNYENYVAREQVNNYLVIEEYIRLFKRLAIKKRRYNYNSIIISLYGYLEKFIENVLTTYVEKINVFISSYEDLPEIIKKQNYRLSLTLLDKVNSNNYIGTLRKEHIVKNLHSCLNFEIEYKLNKEAFAKHSANFRKEIINESFGKVGITNISDLIEKEEIFRNYISNISEELNNEENMSRDFFYYLNDLAERRNDVAHGVPSEILSNEIILDYILFFKYFSKAIINIVDENLLRIEAEFQGKDLGALTDVYSEGNVICIYTNHNLLNINDYIIAYTSEKIIKSKILNIQLDGNDLTNIDGENNYEVGLKLDGKISRNCTLKLINM